MLILTRKSGESITVGETITVTILEVRGAQVKIGIDAPRDVRIHRREVYERILAENKAAATSSPEDLSRVKGLLSFTTGINR